MAIPKLSNDLAAQEARDIQAQIDAENQNGLRNIYNAFKELVECQANDGLIIEYAEPQTVSLDAFRLGLYNPTFRKSLVWAPVREQKQELIDEIAHLISRAGGGEYDDVQLRGEIKNKLQWKSVSELIERRDSILRERELRKRPLNEIKQIVRDSVQPPGYPRLPRTIVPPGQIQAVALDAQYIRDLARYDSDGIRKLNRIYGPEQVNDRLLGRD